MRPATRRLVLLGALAVLLLPHLSESFPTWSRKLRPGGLQAPRGAVYTRAVFDTTHRKMITCFGTDDYYCATSFYQLFALDVSQSRDGIWIRMNPSGSQPPVRSSQHLAYDATHDRMIMFGGSDGNCTPMRDVWELILTPGSEQWRQLSVAGTAPVGSRHGYTVFFEQNQKIYYFGGEKLETSTESYYNDTYVLDVSVPGQATWSQIFPTGAPPSARSQGVATYDSKFKRMLIFGGGVGFYGGVQFQLYNDVYALTLAGTTPSWSLLASNGFVPPGRGGCVAEFDRNVTQSLIVFGGGNFPTGGLNDFRSMRLGGDPYWERLLPSGTTPSPRWNLGSAYDPYYLRVLLFGGGTGDYNQNDYTATNEVWELSLVDPNGTPGPTNTPPPITTPTPTPTPTPTGWPTFTPAWTVTPAPTATPTWTGQPSWTPSPTQMATSTPTLTPSPTQGGNTPTPTATSRPEPLVLVAGYLGTSLSRSGGGTLTLLAVVQSPTLRVIREVELLMNGTPTGTMLTELDQVGGTGTFQLGPVFVGVGAPQGRFSLGLVATDNGSLESGAWPYLTVR